MKHVIYVRMGGKEKVTMETIIRKITGICHEDETIYHQAGDILRSGGLVAFPTETVYGLGADALDREASLKIYRAKGRPSDNPLIVHIADVSDLYRLSSCVTKEALALADAFWPGPLTMVLKKADIVPDTITGGLDTVAIRMPSHTTAANLIRTSNVYIAAPSANISGRPSPTRASHVIEDLAGRIDMIIEDDTVEIGLESTIIDLSGDTPTVLRPGFVTDAMLAGVLGEVQIDPAVAGDVKEGVVPKAPGMKYRHYAPKAQICIIRGQTENVIDYINNETQKLESTGLKVGVMATDETAPYYTCKMVVPVGGTDNQAAVARNLYAVLRNFDQDQVDYIYSESFSEENLGQAIMNRLIKAAGHTIIQV